MQKKTLFTVPSCKTKVSRLENNKFVEADEEESQMKSTGIDGKKNN